MYTTSWAVTEGSEVVGGASYRHEVGKEEGDREAGCDDSAQAFLRIGPQTLAKLRIVHVGVCL
jgi:hypothetical protein